MPEPGRNAAERAVGDRVGVGAEDQRAGESVAVFREDHVADTFASVKFRNALLFDPFPRALLRHGVLRADRWVVMVEHDDDAVGIEHLVTTHLAQEVDRARRTAIVEHDVVRRDIDDLADFDSRAARVLCDDLGYGVHARVSLSREL